MNAFSLKIIAIIGMTLNHIAVVFSSKLPDPVYYVFMACGGLTFPIMAFLMTQGYKYTRNFKRYAVRLLLFAIISLVPFILAFGNTLNVLFTLLLGLIVIYLDDHMISRQSFPLILFCFILLSAKCDWNLIGVPMILLYHKLDEHRAENHEQRLCSLKQVALPLCLIWGLTLLTALNHDSAPASFSQRDLIGQVLFSFIGCTATIPLLLNYNGKRGPKLKYLFYAYYPIHLIVLVILQHYIC